MNNNVIIKSGKALKQKIIVKQFLKYSVVGIFNTIIGLSAIFILYNIYNVNYIWANVFGYALGLINSFTWNKRWTFRSQKHYSKEIIRFLIIFIVSYAVNLIVPKFLK